jgi:hypothetical protein
MNELIRNLEAARKAAGFTKTEMANRLGSPAPQNYTNWINRDSLPKKYYKAAGQLIDTYLGDTGNRVETTRHLDEEFERLSLLTTEQQDFAAIKSIADRVSPADAMKYALFFLERAKSGL